MRTDHIFGGGNEENYQEMCHNNLKKVLIMFREGRAGTQISQFSPPSSIWFKVTEKGETRGVRRLLEQRAPECSGTCDVTRPSWSWGFSLVPSPAPRPRELYRPHWFTATLPFPSFLSSRSAVSSKHTQGKERPMNLPNREVVLGRASTDVLTHISS